MAFDLSWKEYQAQIETLGQLTYNYDETLYHASTDRQGWYADRYHAALAKESPGMPLAGGPFDAAKNMVRLYQFPDPGLIVAVFDPDAALLGRNMLMFARFLWMKFIFGVRITEVIDEIRVADDGAQTKVWGYAYRTLKGHFEIGQILFEVTKNLATGDVAFSINAYSKPERIQNWFYRIGFRIFGRRLQRRFAATSIRRLRVVAQARENLAVELSATTPPISAGSID